MLAAIYQYRSDMLYPPAPDSRERRVAMIDAIINRIEGTDTPPSPVKHPTAFCQGEGWDGTIWIDTVEASTIDEARELARGNCAEDWGYDPEGDVTIADWEDQ